MEYYNLYHNMRLMLEYRGVKDITPELPMDKFIMKMEADTYTLLYGKREATDVYDAAIVAAVLIAKDSDYSTKYANFSKLINTISSTLSTAHPASLALPKNIIVAVSNTSRAKSAKPAGNTTGLSTNINKKLHLDINKDPSKLLVEVYLHSSFVIELPKHSASVKHTIATKEEIEQTVNILREETSKFPSIYVNDPQNIWLGAKVGQIIKIERMSDSAGSAIAYRKMVSSNEISIIPGGEE